MQDKLLTLILFFTSFAATFGQEPELNWVQGIGQGATFVTIQKLALDSEENYLVMGRFLGTADMDPGAGVANLVSANIDIFVGKYDSDGNLIWAQAITGSGSSDDPRDIKTDSQNNVYLSGIITGITDIDPGAGSLSVDPGTIQGSFMTVLDPGGNFLWGYATENIGPFDNNDLSAFDVTSSGEVYFTGTYNGDVDFDFTSSTNQLPSGSSAFFGKLNSDGTLAWVHQITQANYLNSIVVDDLDQSICLVADFPGTSVDVEPNAGVETVFFLENINAVFIKTDMDGNYISHTSIGCNNSNGLQVRKMELTNNELFVYGIFTGTLDLDPTGGANTLVSTNGTGTDQDVFVAKFDNSLNLVWAKQLTGSNYIDKGSMTTDKYGNSYFSGLGYGSTDTDPGLATDVKSAGLYILKLDENGDRVWVYHDPSQYGTNLALIYNKFEHSIIGAGVSGSSVDLDPQAGFFSLPFSAAYLLNWNNCNSVAYETTVSYSAGVLTAVDTLTDDTFQWFDCNTLLPVSGADSSVFEPLLFGSYQVQIANEFGACPSLSDCVLFSDASIDSNLPIDPVDPFAFRVYPNPATSQILIADLKYQFDLVIKNTAGETVYEINDQVGNLSIDVADLVSGIYIIQVTTINGMISNTFTKN